MKIGIIGLGYVGLTLAVVAALKKFKVYGIERNEEIKKCLREKRAHFFEPGLNALIEQCYGKNLFVPDSLSTEKDIQVFIVTVGTPLKADEKTPNFEYIQSALDSIRNQYTGEQLIILRSTISVGTTRNVVIPHLCKLSGKKAEEILIAFCPERTIEGRAVRELQELPQIIGANNQKSLMLAENFFREITPTIIKVDSLEAAELIKLFNNTYRDIHFAIGNVFNEIAQSFGINGVKLIKAANIGYDRSNIPAPGFVGGPCLEKDPYILTNNMRPSEGKQFVINARKYNESLEDKIVSWVKHISTAHGTDLEICISGLAFKGVPDTSDLRGSNSVNIARKLTQLGFRLHLHDFLANSKEIEELHLGVNHDDLYNAVKGKGLLLILNNNQRYSKLDFRKLVGNMQGRKVVLDAWGVIDYFDTSFDSDLAVYTLGNISIQS